jgi:hypothetical protein
MAWTRDSMLWLSAMVNTKFSQEAMQSLQHQSQIIVKKWLMLKKLLTSKTSWNKQKS